MYKVTEFYVQAFTGKSAHRRQVGPARSTRERGEAMRWAQSLCRKADEVLVFSVDGEPTLNLWRPPTLVARLDRDLLKQEVGAPQPDAKVIEASARFMNKGDKRA